MEIRAALGQHNDDNRPVVELVRALAARVGRDVADFDYPPGTAPCLCQFSTTDPGAPPLVECEYHRARTAERDRLAKDAGLGAHGDESGWIIEGAWSSTGSPEYWVGSSAWSSDHRRALRFSRRQDAQQAADLMCAGLNVRICEHIWVAEQSGAYCVEVDAALSEKGET